MNTPVSFEIAKALKEKGFKEGSRKGYLENGELGISHYSGLCWNDDEDYPTKYAAPTIAEVVMWLYDKHKIWISVNIEPNKYFYYATYIDTYHNGVKTGFNSPTEAYEAAIEYTLNNII